MPPPMGVVPLGKIRPQMDAATLFAHRGRRHDVPRYGKEVEQFQLRDTQTRRGQRVHDLVEESGGFREALLAPNDAAEVGHQLGHFLSLLRHDGRVVPPPGLIGQVQPDLPHGRVGHRKIAVQLPHGAVAEHQPLQERVGRKTVGAVDAGAGSLSTGEEPGDAGAAPRIGESAPDEVVRRRSYGDELGAEVVSPDLEAVVDGGEALLQEGAVEVACVEPHMVGAVAVEDALHVPHHHVARRQLGPRM